MAGQRHRQAAPGTCALASPRRRFCSSPLAGLESETSSTSVHASASTATRGSAGGAGSLCLPSSRACAPLPGTARTGSARLSRAARPHRAHPNRESGDDQAVRWDIRLCHLAREGSGLTLFCQPLDSLFSDKHASPSGASWPFFLAVPPFLPSSALFALHPAGSATSHQLGSLFSTACVYPTRH